ncbi:hypothetical protein IF1G_05010 [Cordyceps javanica]|uniref:Uncharacterized protein n=1 Tax=Cordyceps javanica TaxID=43265 RepID=A0A545V3Y2_9HYPO|nr:hypothetical protein IF1G_05010 [Cordyceps javanica]
MLRWLARGIPTVSHQVRGPGAISQVGHRRIVETRASKLLATEPGVLSAYDVSPVANVVEERQEEKCRVNRCVSTNYHLSETRNTATSIHDLAAQALISSQVEHVSNTPPHGSSTVAITDKKKSRRGTAVPWDSHA